MSLRKLSLEELYAVLDSPRRGLVWYDHLDDRSPSGPVDDYAWEDDDRNEVTDLEPTRHLLLSVPDGLLRVYRNFDITVAPTGDWVQITGEHRLHFYTCIDVNTLLPESDSLI